MKILGIESSCDETAAAVVEDGRRVLSSIISSQISIHREYGGVVPEIASRNHVLNINGVVDQALKEANCTLNEVDAIAVTYGAGLIGALLCGVSYAKALAMSTKKPLIAVNHLHGHIAANYIAHQDLTPPYLCLVVSGGHTALVDVKSYTEFSVIGQTADDACGEAFDKVARVLGLPYPGGPEIDKLAKEGKVSISLPKPKFSGGEIKFSYSGIKTAVVNYCHNTKEFNKADVAASFRYSAVSQLIDNTVKCVKKYGYKTVAVAGGVGANSLLREEMEKAGKKYNFRAYFPTPILCTDNAAMIASAGYYDFMENKGIAGLDLNAHAVLGL
ncbi:MAG: tRNA (adenosine(37)-N6)-threonylcarbamoyltransferase complex transferase subunit TsaD [Clostridia bacterium]|nr:tRNA (adenosine(37)-N6)-threonylcarbamoyltransferase complex transferase subunit TsaD [Clostridia bacterium]